jgi:hypothetical protein
VENDKTVCIEGCVSREGQQPLLLDATSFERAKTLSREGRVN